MVRVLCTLENASENIGGVPYTRTDDGMLSDDMDPESAAVLATIPGYSVVEPPPPPVETPLPPVAPAKSRAKAAPTPATEPPAEAGATQE